jgi:hypothetical protein
MLHSAFGLGLQFWKIYIPISGQDSGERILGLRQPTPGTPQFIVPRAGWQASFPTEIAVTEAGAGVIPSRLIRPTDKWSSGRQGRVKAVASAVVDMQPAPLSPPESIGRSSVKVAISPNWPGSYTGPLAGKLRAVDIFSHRPNL